MIKHYMILSLLCIKFISVKIFAVPPQFENTPQAVNYFTDYAKNHELVFDLKSHIPGLLTVLLDVGSPRPVMCHFKQLANMIHYLAFDIGHAIACIIVHTSHIAEQVRQTVERLKDKQVDTIENEVYLVIKKLNDTLVEVAYDYLMTIDNKDKVLQSYEKEDYAVMMQSMHVMLKTIQTAVYSTQKANQMAIELSLQLNTNVIIFDTKNKMNIEHSAAGMLRATIHQAMTAYLHIDSFISSMRTLMLAGTGKTIQ